MMIMGAYRWSRLYSLVWMLMSCGVVLATPQTSDCERALAFCADINYPFEQVEFKGCLWFTFTLEETQQVHVVATSSGGKFGLSGPHSLEDPCRSEPLPFCVSTSMDQLTINGQLQPGVYYITVNFPDGIGSDIDIDVLRGLGCADEELEPGNTDCGSALVFCSDLQQTFPEGWSPTMALCLWYSFVLEETTQVQLSVAHRGSKIYLHGPFEPGAPCPPCGGEALLGGEHVLQVGLDMSPGIYYIAVSLSAGSSPSQVVIDAQEGLACLECDDCLPAFELSVGTPYILNAWVHVPELSGSTTSFTTPKVVIESPPGTYLTAGGPSGPIIDGWQRIEVGFELTSSAAMKALFTASSGTVYYDDIRIFPRDGSMRSYVYDPVNLRFVAELDERHFATFYEYDGEGKLIRVKKETERGVMTIQETRNNSSKLSP